MSQFPTNYWDCDRCTLTNKQENSMCDMCLNPKPIEKIYTICNKCTLQNNPNDKKCYLCEGELIPRSPYILEDNTPIPLVGGCIIPTQYFESKHKKGPVILFNKAIDGKSYELPGESFDPYKDRTINDTLIRGVKSKLSKSINIDEKTLKNAPANFTLVKIPGINTSKKSIFESDIIIMILVDIKKVYNKKIKKIFISDLKKYFDTNKSLPLKFKDVNGKKCSINEFTADIIHGAIKKNII